MLRLLPLLALLAAPAASAQTYYNSLDRPEAAAPREGPGFRLGVGVGPSVYVGPDLLFGEAAFQDDVVSTRLGVLAEVTAPLVGRRLYGRLGAGLLNIGADGDRPDVAPAGANPFLTGPVVLVEGDALFYLGRPGGGLAPYVFTGLAGLVATERVVGDVSRTALAIPVGLGVEVGLGRTLGIFAEASYRFGLTSPGAEATVFPGVVAASGAAARAAVTPSDDVDCSDPAYKRDPKCTTAPPPSCDLDPTLEGCSEVIGDGDSAFDTRFGTGLVLGGVRLGFGRAPAPAAIPDARPVPRPAPVLEPEPGPAVCELVELNAVTFGPGSDVLDRRARERLDENVALLLEDPACCVFVDGYTDTAEAERFGLGLAERRALAVVDYYRGRGVAAGRLEARTLGQALPSCDKEDPGPGCERNRRVESLPLDCERFRAILADPGYDPG